MGTADAKPHLLELRLDLERSGVGKGAVGPHLVAGEVRRSRPGNHPRVVLEGLAGRNEEPAQSEHVEVVGAELVHDLEAAHGLEASAAADAEAHQVVGVVHRARVLAALVGGRAEVRLLPEPDDPLAETVTKLQGAREVEGSRGPEAVALEVPQLGHGRERAGDDGPDPENDRDESEENLTHASEPPDDFCEDREVIAALGGECQPQVFRTGYK